MADRRRLKKYADSIKRAVSEILEFKVTDPRKGFITVTKVKMSPDLRLASIYYTVLGDDKQRDATAQALKHSKAFIKNPNCSLASSSVNPKYLNIFFCTSVSNILNDPPPISTPLITRS